MAKKYFSRYSPDKKVSCFQLILEILCENKALKDDLELLHFFWNHKDWLKFYKSEMRFTSKYCKLWGEEKVLDFVWRKNIWSLKAKWIATALEEHKYVKQKTDIVSIVENREARVKCAGESRTNDKVKNILDLLDG